MGHRLRARPRLASEMEQSCSTFRSSQSDGRGEASAGLDNREWGTGAT